MKQFLWRLGMRIQHFMQGRYGGDELSRLMSVVVLVLLLLSLFPYLWVCYIPAWLLMIWSLYRILSRNISKRQAELYKYLTLRSKVKTAMAQRQRRWKERKTHRYYRCPECKAWIRIRKPGKGRKIKIVCPKCSFELIKKT